MEIIKFIFKRNNGYTLLELMATLGIFAALVAIAIPTYTAQLNKSRVASALNTLSGLERAAKIAYEENPHNISIAYGGIDLANNTVTALAADPVINALYIYPGGDPTVEANQFLVCVYVGKLKFSGYLAPTAGTTGAYSRVCKLTTDNDAIYTNKCGALQGDALDVPTTYLPTACDCANILGGAC